MTAVDHSVVSAQEMQQNTHREFFYSALKSAITRESNPAAKRTYENLLKKFQADTKGISDECLNEFHRLSKEKKTLKQIVHQMNQQPQANLSLTTNIFTPEADLDPSTVLQQVQIQVADNIAKQGFFKNRIAEIQDDQQQIKQRHKDDNEDFRKKLINQKEDIDRLEKTNKSLLESLDKKDEEIRKLKIIIARLEDEKRELEKRIQKLTDSLSAVEETVKELKEENQKFKHDSESMHEQFTRLEGELEATKQQVGIDEANKDQLMLGQVIVDFEKKLYLTVHPKADKRRNHQVKMIEKDIRKFCKTEPEKLAATERWEKAKKTIDWDSNLTAVTEEIRAERNTVAHPTVSSRERRELLVRLEENPDVPEEDYEEYVKIFTCYDKLEKATIP